MTGSVIVDDAPASPCTGVCRLDEVGVCEGCLRSGAEIMAWPGLDAGQKRSVLTHVAQRHARRQGQKVHR